MIWYKTALIYQIAANLDTLYPRVGGNMVDGRLVADNIPNISSIESSLSDYKVLPGIREVSMNLFSLTGTSYSVEEDKRISDLALQIEQNKRIDPLIVVHEKAGPYILEGGHRADALFRLKAKSFPALVVVDLSD